MTREADKPKSNNSGKTKLPVIQDGFYFMVRSRPFPRTAEELQTELEALETKQIQKLDAQGIDYEGFGLLMAKLENNSSLTHLNLNKFTIRGDQSQNFISAFTKNSTVNSLSVKGTKIYFQTLEAVLLQNHTITTLKYDVVNEPCDEEKSPDHSGKKSLINSENEKFIIEFLQRNCRLEIEEFHEAVEKLDLSDLSFPVALYNIIVNYALSDGALIFLNNSNKTETLKPEHTTLSRNSSSSNFKDLPTPSSSPHPKLIEQWTEKNRDRNIS